MLERPHSPTTPSPSSATSLATCCQTSVPSVSFRSWTSTPPGWAFPEQLGRQRVETGIEPDNELAARVDDGSRQPVGERRRRHRCLRPHQPDRLAVPTQKRWRPLARPPTEVLSSRSASSLA